MRFLVLVIAGLAFASPCYADDVWVQVRESRVRVKPLFYATTIQ